MAEETKSPKPGKRRRVDTSGRFPDDPTTNWARVVVDGKIVAGELVCHAAERHLRDIIDGAIRDLYWAPERADHALGFYPACLSITEGAKVGEPFHLLDWHTFSAGNLFGWRRSSGRMRYRSAWLETGKGQAKSPFMAATGLYMMGYYGVQRAKVYAIGQDKQTANVLFKDAAAMCRAPIPGTDPELNDTLEGRGEVIIRGLLDNAYKIEHPQTNSVFQSLANGEAISGPRPILVAADEIHEMKTNVSIEMWKRALAKIFGDALMLLGTNTPATTQIVGTEYSEFYQRVVKGEIDDDEAFAFIARVDKADRKNVFDNEACWPKALPALGITFPIENIRGEVKTARSLISTAMSVKRLYFGIPIGSVDFWIKEEAWAAAQGKVDLPALKKCRCWLSLDLSKKNDLTSLTAVWIDDQGHLWAKTWYWTTKDGLKDRAKKANAPYEKWVQEELLVAVDGSVIDYTFVAARVQKLVEEFDVQFMAFDPAKIGDFIQACDSIGFPVWLWEGPDTPAGRGLMLAAHGQGNKVLFYKELDENKKPVERLCMPRSIERLEDRILTGGITIEDSPVTYFCAGNAFVLPDGQNNRCFDKKRSRGPIDGMVTIAMGAGAATFNLKKPAKSFWQR
jgi:phage terminase large subunit-like protein